MLTARREPRRVPRQAAPSLYYPMRWGSGNSGYRWCACWFSNVPRHYARRLLCRCEWEVSHEVIKLPRYTAQSEKRGAACLLGHLFWEILCTAAGVGALVMETCFVADMWCRCPRRRYRWQMGSGGVVEAVLRHLCIFVLYNVAACATHPPQPKQTTGMVGLAQKTNPSTLFTVWLRASSI